MQRRQAPALGRSSKDAPYTAVPIEDSKVQGRNVRVFLNRHLLTKALRFGLPTIEIIDARSAVPKAMGRGTSITTCDANRSGREQQLPKISVGLDAPT